MNTTQKLILALLHSAVTGEAQPLPYAYSLEEALPVIKKQGLTTLAYEGSVVCGISPQDPIMQALFRGYYSLFLQSERQMKIINRLFHAFESSGIDYLPFKGCVMKQLYPRQELRLMGDADVLIRVEQYETIKPILTEMGFTFTAESETDCVWDHSDLHLELHKQLEYVCNKDFCGYFQNCWERAIPEQGRRYKFSPEDSYIHLFTHFSRHYRSGGIGCRHALDLWVFRTAYPDLNLEYVHGELEKLGLTQFHDNTMHMLEAWFEGGQLNDITEYMTQQIFSGGAFGTLKGYLVFLEMSRQQELGKERNTKISYNLRLVFPPLVHMQSKYPILTTWPVLLPLFWLVRIIAGLADRRRRRRALSQFNQVSEQALEDHTQALAYVGLVYDPEGNCV